MSKIFAILLAASLTTTASAAPVTPCEIAAAPEEYAGKTITLSADFTTDLRHLSLLTHPRCPGVVVVPYDSEGKKHASVMKFDNAVSGQINNHRPRVFSIVAVGTFALDSSTAIGRFTIRKIMGYKRVVSLTQQ